MRIDYMAMKSWMVELCFSSFATGHGAVATQLDLQAAEDNEVIANITKLSCNLIREGLSESMVDGCHRRGALKIDFTGPN